MTLPFLSQNKSSLDSFKSNLETFSSSKTIDLPCFVLFSTLAPPSSSATPACDLFKLFYGRELPCVCVDASVRACVCVRACTRTCAWNDLSRQDFAL